MCSRQNSWNFCARSASSRRTWKSSAGTTIREHAVLPPAKTVPLRQRLWFTRALSPSHMPLVKGAIGLPSANELSTRSSPLSTW